MSYSKRERKIWTQSRTQGRRLCDNRDKDWTHAARSQRMPRLADGHQKLEEARNDSPPELSEATRTCQNLDFRLLVSRSM